MEYQSIKQIETLATLHPVKDGKAPSRCERLARWADALERHGGDLCSLRRTEYASVRHRALMREDGSALTVAFEDPVLRGWGLGDDTYGRAISFFELSHADMHRILCYCHSGNTVSAHQVAERVRQVAESGAALRRGLAQFFMIASAITAAAALAVLM